MGGNKLFQDWNIPPRVLTHQGRPYSMVDPGQKVMKGLIEVFILESLDASPTHGYALLKEMEARFGQEPNRNKIYPLLQKMEEGGLIERRPDESDGGRGKTLYALTDLGREELESYRRLPRAFREAIHRLWEPPAPDEEPAPPASAPSASMVAPLAPAPPAPPSREVQVTGPSLTVRPRAAPEGGLPYPCPDARVQLSKDARTGDLDLTLTGCPMGAYDYCPVCPVYQSVAGLRKLVFGAP